MVYSELMVIYSEFSYEKWGFSIVMLVFPIKNGDFPSKNGDFPIKKGDFPMKNGDLSIVFGMVKPRGKIAADLGRSTGQPGMIAIDSYLLVICKRGYIWNINQVSHLYMDYIYIYIWIIYIYGLYLYIWIIFIYIWMNLLGGELPRNRLGGWGDSPNVCFKWTDSSYWAHWNHEG